MNRRTLRFGLRTLLAVVTLCALVGGWFADGMHRRQAAIRSIEAAGGSVSSEFHWREREVGYSSVYRKRLPDAKRTWSELVLGDRQRDVAFKYGEGVELSTDTLDALATLHELRQLGLSTTSVDDDDLARLSPLLRMEVLCLDGCPITDRSAAALARFQELRWLELDDTQITDKAAPYLAN